MMEVVKQNTDELGVKLACSALAVPKASYYRWLNPKPKCPNNKPKPPLALSDDERQTILDIMNSERFVDKSPWEIYPTLLDEGQHYCSIRTMYRLLEDEGEVKERRAQRRHNNYQKPELLATGPNQVWSWDITKLKGPKKWTYFYLYVIMDIFSRNVVGWMVMHKEAAYLAEQLIAQSCKRQGIQPGQLTIHADRGPSMKSKPVAFLLADLGITKTHNRPYTSNDNPFSESQFKTLKYCPEFPGSFGCIEDARSFCRQFFRWYNEEHRHSGISSLTPHMVHYGMADDVLGKREDVLRQAFEKNPERFKHKIPKVEPLHDAVWINKPELENLDEKLAA